VLTFCSAFSLCRQLNDVKIKTIICIGRCMPFRFSAEPLCRLLAFATTLVVASAVWANPIGYSVRSDGDDNLYRIDLGTGVATQLGATGFPKIEGLALNSAGDLFGVNPSQSNSQLVRCSTTTGQCTSVGLMGVPAPSGTNAGLAFAANGSLYMALNAIIYWVNPATGQSAPIGISGPAISGLGSGAVSANCASGLYALGGNTNQGELFCVNTANGALTSLGTLSTASVDAGFDGDATTGLLWGITNPSSATAPAQVYSVNPATLSVSAPINVTLGGVAIGGFESLAVVPTSTTSLPPAVADGTPNGIPTLSTWASLLMGLLLVGVASRRFLRAPSARRIARS
jgi:hypothetical protein